MSDRSTGSEQLAALIVRVAQQDRQAFAELYDQLATLLYSTALRILGDPADAEEVTQDVFLQIWEKAASFQPGVGNPTYWTVAMARNRCIDRLRQKQRRATLSLDRPEDLPELPAGPTAAAESESLNRDEQAAVRTALRTLPPDQRQALELAFFGGLSHQEIAAQLNEPLGTIKARIRRALLKLRDLLGDYV